jgi:hypothetical protein
MIITKTIETKTTEEFTITGEFIAQMLVETGKIKMGENSFISVQFDVPGGGDWSNTTLDVGEAYPLRVTVSNTEITEEK